MPTTILSNRSRRTSLLARSVLLCCLACLSRSAPAQTIGALGNGLNAAAEGRGGELVAEQGSALDAMEGNPAGLAGIETRMLELSGVGVLAGGSYQNSVDRDGRLHGASGLLPYGAFASPLGTSGRWTAGLSITPEFTSKVDWRFVDPPGTAGVTYGYQNDESRIVVLRSAAGLAAALGPHWAVGATLGLSYNTNRLNSPYIFQEQPQLAGLKVLLDMNTRGFGWNGGAGIQWQPSDTLRLGASWKSGTYVQSHGSAVGNAYALFNALNIPADPAFRYQGEVDNHLPQSATAGLVWQQSRRLHWAAEGDWVGWNSAFRILSVKMKQGTNPVINSVVGSDAFEDEIALHWRNQGVLHLGLGIPFAEHWIVRAGYAFMSNAVPSSTLTPMTAAILRNSLSTGASWSRGAWTYSAAYNARLPTSQSVGQSALLAGEFSNSHVRVLTQSLTITTRLTF